MSADVVNLPTNVLMVAMSYRIAGVSGVLKTSSMRYRDTMHLLDTINRLNSQLSDYTYFLSVEDMQRVVDYEHAMGRSI